MSIDTQAIIKEYQQEAGDTGSTNVQVALLTNAQKRSPLKKRSFAFSFSA